MSAIKYLALTIVAGIVLAALLLILCSTPSSGVVMKTIEIKAPVERSFSYMADAQNWAGCLPASVSDIQGQGEGQTWRFAYEFGLPSKMLEQDCAWVEYEPGKRLLGKCGNTGLNDGAYTFIFTSVPGGVTRMVWISEGSSYFPAAISATSLGREWFSKNYQKYMDDFAACVKKGIAEQK
ncbi:MAG TPA: SRPBCC family protein [bacterium]|nr:SRPBCC family protein [bacterium]